MSTPWRCNNYELYITNYVTPMEPTNNNRVAEFLDVLSSQMEEEGSF